jgi:hypothetical protein
MGILTDELGRPRWSGGGLVLLLVLFPLLIYPLWQHRDINHPLSAQLQVDLCRLLPAPPANLPGPLHAVGQNANGNISCEYRDQGDKLTLGVMLMTTRTASIGGGAARTSAIYQTWIKEVKASGAVAMRDEPGPWAMARSYRNGSTQQMLIEDHGVMLALNSPTLSADEMAVYARQATAALRAP